MFDHKTSHLLFHESCFRNSKIFCLGGFGAELLILGNSESNEHNNLVIIGNLHKTSDHQFSSRLRMMERKSNSVAAGPDRIRVRTVDASSEVASH